MTLEAVLALVADLITGSSESTSWTFLVIGTESRFCFVRVSSTSPHGSPISFGSLFPSSGRFWVCAFSGRRWSRFGRLVQVLPSLFPPVRWSWSVSVGLRFSFPLPFQGLPAPGQVCWCVFSPSLLFLRSPLGSLLSNCSFHLHRHLTFILFHPHLHLIAGALSELRP